MCLCLSHVNGEDAAEMYGAILERGTCNETHKWFLERHMVRHDDRNYAYEIWPWWERELLDWCDTEQVSSETVGPRHACHESAGQPRV